MEICGSISKYGINNFNLYILEGEKEKIIGIGIIILIHHIILKVSYSLFQVIIIIDLVM